MKVRVHRRPKPAVRRRKVLRFLDDLISTIIEGLLLAAILKWIGW